MSNEQILIREYKPALAPKSKVNWNTETNWITDDFTKPKKEAKKRDKKITL